MDNFLFDGSPLAPYRWTDKKLWITFYRNSVVPYIVGRAGLRNKFDKNSTLSSFFLVTNSFSLFVSLVLSVINLYHGKNNT
jgi:hypothetical protein